MSLVGREVVPEIVEVDTLATLNQGFGGRAIEAEVPYGGVVVNRLPTLYAGKESIHQDELRHLGRKLCSVGVSNHETDVMSHDLRLLHAERLSKVVNTDGGILHVKTVGRDVRVSYPGQVWCDYGKPLGQNGDDRLPHQRGLGVTMQQYERCAVPGPHVVQLGALDFRCARDDGLVLRTCRGLCGESSTEQEQAEHGHNESGFHKLASSIVEYSGLYSLECAKSIRSSRL